MANAIIRHTVLFLATIAIFGSGRPAATAADELDEVLRGMRTGQEQALHQGRFRIRYTQRREGRDVPPGLRVDARLLEIENAMCGGAFYFRSHYVETDDHRSDAELAVWRDGICTFRNGTGVHIQTAPHPMLFDRFYYWTFAYIDVFQDLPILIPNIEEAAGGKSYSDVFQFALPRMVERAAEDYTVRSNRETIHGVDCVVLERPGRDIIWVDPAHGYLCRKRMIYFRQGQLLITSEVPELLEVHSEAWLPRVEIYTRYNRDDAPEDMRGKIRDIMTNTVVETDFENVDPAAFVVPIENNDVISDGITHTQYKKMPAEMPFDEILQATLTAAQRDLAAGNRGRLPWASFLIALNVFGALFISFIFLLKRRVG